MEIWPFEMNANKEREFMYLDILVSLFCNALKLGG